MQAPRITLSSYLDSELQGDPVFQNTLSPEPLGKEQEALRSQEPETECWGGQLWERTAVMPKWRSQS